MEHLFRHPEEFFDKVRSEILRGKAMAHSVAVEKDTYQEVVLVSGNDSVHHRLLQNRLRCEAVEYDPFFLGEESDGGL